MIRLLKKKLSQKEDLLRIPLILPERYSVQSEIANWFGKDFEKLNIAFISNLGTNAGVMAIHGLGYPVSQAGGNPILERRFTGAKKTAQPQVKANTIMAWRRNLPQSKAIRLFINMK